MPKLLASNTLRLLILLAIAVCSGCAVLPEITHEPTLHNPFPQISQVAVAPFYNLAGNEKALNETLDGQKVALAYAQELQTVAGFEVIPVGVTETAILQYHLRLEKPEDCRRLAQILDVDAVVVGAVTDFDMWRPPHMTIKVSWFTANPYYHPIPAGYGLPWGTSREKDIPGPVVFEAEMELAKAQLKTQTPNYAKTADDMQPIGNLPASDSMQSSGLKWRSPMDNSPAAGKPSRAAKKPAGIVAENGDVRTTSYDEALTNTPQSRQSGVADQRIVMSENIRPGMENIPPNWPDPRGFVPPPPTSHPQPAGPSNEPVLKFIKSYRGDDAEFTSALQSYCYFRDDERLGGWGRYLERSDDFIRFCCHMHIWEMLGSRGGAGESKVVWRWTPIR